MSDSTSNLDLLTQGQGGKELTANALFDAVSPAMIYGRRRSTTSGLTWGYFGGRIGVAGTTVSVANGTLTLTASTTNYLMADKVTGAVSVNTTGFVAGKRRLYSIVTGSTTVTSYTDYRFSGESAKNQTAPAIATGVLTLDLESAALFAVALNANITTLTLSNAPPSGLVVDFTLVFTADGTVRTITWPASVLWPGGVAPTMTGTLNQRDMFRLISYDGGTSYLAYILGQNF